MNETVFLQSSVQGGMSQAAPADILSSHLEHHRNRLRGWFAAAALSLALWGAIGFGIWSALHTAG